MFGEQKMTQAILELWIHFDEGRFGAVPFFAEPVGPGVGHAAPEYAQGKIGELFPVDAVNVVETIDPAIAKRLSRGCLPDRVLQRKPRDDFVAAGNYPFLAVVVEAAFNWRTAGAS